MISLSIMNNIAEYQNHTIVECIHALLYASHLPKLLWTHVVFYIVWLMNWISSKAIEEMIPFELVYRKKSGLRALRKWKNKMLVHQTNSNKLGRHTKQEYWIGYNSKSNGSLLL